MEPCIMGKAVPFVTSAAAILGAVALQQYWAVPAAASAAAAGADAAALASAGAAEAAAATAAAAKAAATQAAIASQAANVMYSLGGSMLMGAVLGALMPTEMPKGMDRKISIQSAEVFQRVTWGRVIAPTNIINGWTHGSDNVYLTVLLYVATQESDGIEGLVVDGRRVTLEPNSGTTPKFPYDWSIPKYNEPGGGRFFWQDDHPRFACKFFSGGSGQQADPWMVQTANGKYTAASRCTGHTLLAMCFNYHPQVYQGLPEVFVVLRGRRVFDPRSGSTQWSENPALIVADMLKHPLVVGAPITVDQASLIDAANACDVMVTNKDATTRKRYVAGGILSSDQPPLQIVEDVLQAMAGAIAWTGEQPKIYAGVARTPIADTIGADDLVNTVQWTPSRKLAERVNEITAFYEDIAKTPQRKETPRRIDSSAQALDGVPMPSDLQLRWVHEGRQAQHLSKIALGWNRLAQRLTVHLAPKWIVLEAGDVVRVTIPTLQITDKQFMVARTEPQTNGIVLAELVEYDGAIYSWNATVDELSDEPVTQDDSQGNVTGVPAVQNLAVSFRRNWDQSLLQAVVIWTPDTSGDVTGMEMEYIQDEIAIAQETGQLSALNTQRGLKVATE
ncbi:MAG: phage tail protein, partial [Steroidobacteraceae bacterium]|nr:phage tail protein [Steroidobacteraceae bacterium]